MNRFIYTLITLFALLSSASAQTLEEMTQEKNLKEAELAEKEAQLKSLTGEVEALKSDVATLTDKITPYPRWDVGANGNVGVNFATFSDWLSKSQSSTTAVNLGMTLSGYANMDQKKYFWRNGGNLTLGWLKFDDKDDPNDPEGFRVAADALNITSLFGYKLSSKLALSALAEYRSSILEGRLNNPGYLDVGVGVTWTPITDLVVVVHPLNYNLVFASDDGFDYQSSAGAKVVADYKRAITKNLHWRSNLSAFMSYEGSDLSNWTWINGLTTAVKGIGVGFDLGLRSNKQEALAAGLTDNPLQTYWILGLSYAL